MLLDRIVEGIVDDSLDWFFKRILKDHYDQRRHKLADANKNAIPAIDYILSTCLGKDNVIYPPESTVQWQKYYHKLEAGSSKVFKQILLIYLRLDIGKHLIQNETNGKPKTKDKSELGALETALSKLISLPISFDFPNSVIHLGEGLWAVDNEELSLTISSLSDPSINLANYFESQKELRNIIVDSLIINHQSRMALFMSKTHRYEKWDEDFDPVYTFLLISSGQLIEALKYERLFSDRDNYHDILQRFFELCSEWNVTKSLNCLNLSIDEEEVLNQHLIIESRPVTPSSVGTQIKSQARSTSSKPKPRNRSIQVVQRTPTFNDSPARNTRSARKKKTTK